MYMNYSSRSKIRKSCVNHLVQLYMFTYSSLDCFSMEDEWFVQLYDILAPYNYKTNIKLKREHGIFA